MVQKNKNSPVRFQQYKKKSLADKESANMHRESTGLYKIIKSTHLENDFYFKHTCPKTQ